MKGYHFLWSIIKKVTSLNALDKLIFIKSLTFNYIIHINYFHYRLKSITIGSEI